MHGLILFADDKIHINDFDSTQKTLNQSPENRLFQQLQQSCAVLGVNDLIMAKNTIKELGAFNVLIVDWDFNSGAALTAELPDDDDTVSMVGRPSINENETLEFLMSTDIYSLIYVYSSNAAQVKAEHFDTLIARYPGRLQIHDKDQLEATEEEAKRIISDIEKWKSDNVNLTVPFSWSQSINKSVKRMFMRLQSADPNWISELYKTAEIDGVEPSIEVVNLFQNLLSENIIQDSELLDKITEIATTTTSVVNAEDYANLIQILYFSKTKETEPIMTGDIFRDKVDKDKYHIVITPECDIRHVDSCSSTSHWEVLSFSKNDFKKGNYGLKADIKAKPVIDKAESYKICSFTKNQKIELSQVLNDKVKAAERKLHVDSFTQTLARYHLIPCFEFDKGDLSGVIQIDFRNALNMIPGNEFTKEDRLLKLNTPFIQELRQRFYAYKGRVGVPGYSKTLREWVIDKN
jgi:hypothetical protein